MQFEGYDDSIAEHNTVVDVLESFSSSEVPSYVRNMDLLCMCCPSFVDEICHLLDYRILSCFSHNHFMCDWKVAGSAVENGCGFGFDVQFGYYVVHVKSTL